MLYEALARLRDESGLIMPGDFLPVLEFKGLEAEFDRLVIRKVLTDLDLGYLPPSTGVSINLSAALLMQHDMVEVLAPLRRHLRSRDVMLEVTETAMVTSLNQVAQRLMALREQGFTIALDDFGSGYSSLSYLSRMPVDVVKFDIGMVRDLIRDGAQRNIVRGMASVIREAGYQLVAEEHRVRRSGPGIRPGRLPVSAGIQDRQPQGPTAADHGHAEGSSAGRVVPYARPQSDALSFEAISARYLSSSSSGDSTHSGFWGMQSTGQTTTHWGVSKCPTHSVQELRIDLVNFLSRVDRLVGALGLTNIAVDAFVGDHQGHRTIPRG